MLFSWQVYDDSRHLLKQSESYVSFGTLHIKADLPSCTLGSVRASAKIPVSHNERIFINGYQTWTSCPELGYYDRIRGLNSVPKVLKDKFAFDRYGDYHFVGYPEKKGILHGFSWMTLRRGGYYRLLASLDERPGYTMFTLDCENEEIRLERDCAGLETEGEYPLFDLFYAEGTEQQVFDAWFHAMNIHPRTMSKIAGYSSWYNRYQKISEESILQDLKGCSELFCEGDLFQIDDGWEEHVGDWLRTDRKKFPHGMKEMADRIHSAGFKAGLWLAPFAAEEESVLYKEHPDWFYKADGLPWKCGSNWSGFFSLDINNPEVIAYLREVFDTVLNKWGYDLVKLDFLYAAAPFGNAEETRAGRMYRAMEMLREWCGDKLMLGCGVPVMPAFGIADYCRISCDVTLDWDDKLYMRAFHRERTSTKNAVANILSRRQLNSRAYLSDPDVFFLRSNNISLNEKQKSSLAQLDALLGGVFLISDDPSSYTEEMKRKYREYRKLMQAHDIRVRVIGERAEISCLLDDEELKLILF